MKAKIISKRVLSVILCTVMLFSCWVFTAPMANAATTKYKVRLHVHENDSFDPRTNDYSSYPGPSGSSTGGEGEKNQSWYCATLGGWQTGTSSTLMPRAVSPSTGTWTSWWQTKTATYNYPTDEYCRITYKTNNGTTNGSTKYLAFYIADRDGSGNTNVVSGGGVSDGYFPSNAGVEIDGFPTACFAQYYKAGGMFTDQWTGILEIYNNSTSSWVSLGSQSQKNPDSNNYLAINFSVGAANFPRSTANGSETFSNVTFPESGSVSSSTTPTTTLVDQYGVSYSTANFSLTGATSNYSACTPSISDLTVTVPTQVATVGTNSQTISVTCCWASANSSGNRTYTKTFTVTDHLYTVTWKYYASSSSSTTGTLTQYTTNTTSYGDKVTVPSNVGESYTKYYTTTKHYTGGSFSSYANDTVTANVSKTMTGYTSANHNYNYTELESTDSNYHVKHLATCSANCGYSKTENHRYGATSFDFATNGKTATASRTCSDCNHTQEETVTCTSKEKIPATCLVKGWTTYTATSPFDGDTATDTTDVQDIDASGHSWNPTTFSWSEAGTTATATRVCKNDSDHTETQNATMSHAQTKAPTCTEKGIMTYTATSPFSGDTATKTNDVDIPAIGHHFPNSWTSFDGTDTYHDIDSTDPDHDKTYSGAEYHKHSCDNAGCSDDSVQDKNGKWQTDYAPHNWSGWQNVAPTAEETGVRATVRQKLVDAQYNEETSHYNYCTVCGYTKIESHPPVEQWTIDQEHTYPATCEAAGQTTSECPDCHKTKVTPIAATGHTWVRWDGCNEEKISELSGAVPVIFKCENGCNKFCSSYYDEKTHKYESTGNAGDYEYVIGQDTASIPTPSFNEHFEHFDGQMEPYRYAERKASLRVRPSEKDDPTQAMRFSGNLSASNIIGSVDFNVNPTLIIKNYTEDMPAKDAKLMSLEEIRNNRDAYDDNTVIDFGFVFTQARFIRSAKETIDYDLMTLDNIGTNYRIYRMSVVGNNLANYNQDKTIENWKGLTMIGEEATFNLVIDVNKKNYQATYVARTYVIYKYHGDIICVYDQPNEDTGDVRYSHDSVYNQADKVLTLTEPTDFVRRYLKEKIINNTATQNFVDWNWNYTLKDFPKVEED